MKGTIRDINKCSKKNVAYIELSFPKRLRAPNVLISPQATHIVRFYSGGREEEVESFIDNVFDGQKFILNDAAADMTRLQVHEILSEWATAEGSVTTHQFER